MYVLRWVPIFSVGSHLLSIYNQVSRENIKHRAVQLVMIVKPAITPLLARQRARVVVLVTSRYRLGDLLAPGVRQGHICRLRERLRHRPVSTASQAHTLPPGRRRAPAAVWVCIRSAQGSQRALPVGRVHSRRQLGLLLRLRAPIAMPGSTQVRASRRARAVAQVPIRQVEGGRRASIVKRGRLRHLSGPYPRQLASTALPDPTLARVSRLA